MLKKRLIRIIVGAVIYAAAILIDIFAGINHWIVFGIFLVSFLIIGGDVIWKALRIPLKYVKKVWINSMTFP